MPQLARAGKPTLHYVVDDFTDPWRERPVVLLQHGFGRSGEFWRAWVPYLARFYRVVRPDLRGLGRSPVDFDPRTGISINAYIEDLAALVDALGGQPVHYCGESLAGIIGLAFAATRPDLVRTLTLVSSPLRFGAETQRSFAFGHPTWEEAMRTLGIHGWAAAAASAHRFPPGTEPALLDWFAAESGKSDLEVMVAMAKLAETADATGYLPRVRAPVLGLYPSPAPVTVQEAERALRAGLSDLRIVRVPCAYHMIQTLLPATCARQLLYFAAARDGLTCDEA